MPSRLVFALPVALGLAAILAGCQTPATALAPVVVTTGCPDVEPHDAAWQKTLVTALGQLPPASPLRTVTKEWAAGRNQSRACRGSK